MAIKLVLIFIFLFKLSYNIYIYHPNLFFEYIEEEKVDKKDLDNIIKKLSDGFEEAYAFYTLSKNPPKTGYPDITHNKVDIKEELSKISTTNKSFYSFLQDVLKVFGKVKDGHTTMSFLGINNFTKTFYNSDISFYLPVIFNIKNDTNGIPRMYSRPNKNATLNKQFKNYQEIFEIINKTKNIPIKSINGKDPFDFITNFGGDFRNIRNPHGAFTRRFNDINKYHLGNMPLYKENLTNFTVVYENNLTFKTDLFIMSNKNIFQKHNVTPIQNFNQFFLNSNIFENILNDFIFIPEIKELPYELMKLNEYGEFEFTLDSHINSLNGTSINWKDWNYSTPDNFFKCRVDKENEFNVYFIRSFSPGTNITIFKFIDTIEKCAKLFDKDENNFKTILITSMNGGGLVAISEFLLQIISPYTSTNFYTSIRATQTIKNNYKGIYNEIDKCKVISQVDILNNAIPINYGNETEYISDPFIMVYQNLRKKSDEIRKSLKHKKKPNEIIVFTDGFSFSATSMLIKYLQYYGGGIVVGYFGNPKINTTFDSSLSPSPIINIRQLAFWNQNFRELLEKYKIKLQFAYFQTFTDPKNISIPLEFSVTPVDERMALYENFNESNYHVFVEKAKEIFAKYQKKCSKINKNLVLFNSNCTFKEKNLLGGNPCGDNGEWDTSTCVPAYCDNNYIFDKINQKCNFDNCIIIESDELFFYSILITFFISLLTILVMMIYGFAICCCCRSKRKINFPDENLLLNQDY